MGGGGFGWNAAVVLTPVIAEDYSLADDAEGSPLVIRGSKQLWAVVENIVTVPEPIEHSVDKRPSEAGSSPVDIVTVPVPIEHSYVRGGGALLRLPLVSGWSTLRIPGIGRMVGRAIQMTVLPQLALVAALRDGVKSAARVGRSRRAAERILEDVGILCGRILFLQRECLCYALRVVSHFCGAL